MVSGAEMTVSQCHEGGATLVTVALVFVTPPVIYITLRICSLEKGMIYAYEGGAKCSVTP